MRQLVIIIILVFIFCTSLFSQTVESVLTEVAKNNTSLSVLRKRIDAEKIGNKTGIYLENPEAEFHYLWGSPSAIGNRQDINAIQKFDFPTAYKYKSQISNISNEQAELEYHKQKMEILLKTKLLLYNLIYHNALKAELSKRVEHANTIASSYSSRFENGDANILEYNKTKITLLNAKKELEAVEITRLALLSELTGLNGGNFSNFNVSSFPQVDLPDDFEQWYTIAEKNNPILKWLKQEIEKSDKQVKLEKALSLPGFKGGYLSEKLMNEHFQGIIIGMSIPLWQNKNKVKYTKAKKEAISSTIFNTKLQFYNHLKTMHNKAVGLKMNVLSYRNQLNSLGHNDLLQKALDAGEISLIDYIIELSIYYDSTNEILQLEREMNKTVARLNQFM